MLFPASPTLMKIGFFRVSMADRSVVRGENSNYIALAALENEKPYSKGEVQEVGNVSIVHNISIEDVSLFLARGPCPAYM